LDIKKQIKQKKDANFTAVQNYANQLLRHDDEFVSSKRKEFSYKLQLKKKRETVL
jgi:hypothetical protein